MEEEKRIVPKEESSYQNVENLWIKEKLIAKILKEMDKILKNKNCIVCDKYFGSIRGRQKNIPGRICTNCFEKIRRSYKAYCEVLRDCKLKIIHDLIKILEEHGKRD